MRGCRIDLAGAIALALATVVFAPVAPLAAQETNAAVARDTTPNAAAAAEPSGETRADSIEVRNKALARGFYEDLWFTDQTDRYTRYLADEYVVHDTGDRKGVTEPAIRQKEIADFFHSQGEMTGSIDYQVADGDLVATRWQWRLEPTSLMFRIMGGRDQIPIINVFRFDEEGKIVEIWNHRHDIDTGAANFKFIKGLAVGLVFALLGWGVAFFLWRRKRLARSW